MNRVVGGGCLVQRTDEAEEGAVVFIRGGKGPCAALDPAVRRQLLGVILVAVAS